MPGKDDTANLRALDENALGDPDDTDSLPTLPDTPGAPSPEAGSRPRDGSGKTVDRLDWLINITTAVDKRLERVEAELHQLRVLLAEERKDKRKPGSAFASLVADIRRRFR